MRRQEGSECSEGVEIADQILVGADIDRTLAPHAGIGHAQEGGRHVVPGDTSHVQRGHEGGDVLDDATSHGEQAGAATESGLLERHEQLDGLRQGLGVFGGLQEDDGLLCWKADPVPEEGIHQDQVRLRLPCPEIGQPLEVDAVVGQ